MSEFKVLFVEGSSINRPPMFSGMNYAFWKIRMKIFMESIDSCIWEVVVHGPFMPIQVVKDETVVKPRSEWNESEKKKAQYDLVAKNIITSALTMDEFFRISQCNSAKEMMQHEENIANVQKRFTHIVNHLIGLGKVFDKEALNIKVLKCLDRSWQPKVTVISESIDLSNLSTAALSEEAENVEHDETLSLLTRKFSKFLNKKGRDRTQQKRRYPKLNESNSSNYTCFGCGKTGHIKMDCPNNQTKEKPTNKKVERSKGTRAYISWEENEVSSTSSSSIESEETNMCFMMKDEGSIFDSVSHFSMESKNYDQLLVAFKETHDEANRLAIICTKLQNANNVLAPKVKSLEEELYKAKTDLKNSKRNQWYLDSGCSKHMTGDLTKFTSLKLKAEELVTYGDNNRGRILGRGTFGTGSSTTIENVLYVEGLRHSLLSIS
ncbi:uncharacterized protein [Phaseolus vulgaris]|uniref:uncharacterized protein n=1 Tax=Phaseolus vulgaris TaxID=3885 RepID=UPI0035C9AA74